MAIKLKRTSAKTIRVPAAATPEPSVKAEPRAKVDRFTHSLEFAYGGDSPVTTSRRSKTALRVDEFGTAPDLTLTDRDRAAMDPLKAQYGNKAFKRGDLDVGIANRLMRKGLLKHVSGEVRDEQCRIAFVK